jgi:hypothetical protein
MPGSKVEPAAYFDIAQRFAGPFFARAAGDEVGTLVSFDTG